jgi:hypothetical protein
MPGKYPMEEEGRADEYPPYQACLGSHLAHPLAPETDSPWPPSTDREVPYGEQDVKQSAPGYRATRPPLQEWDAEIAV